MPFSHRPEILEHEELAAMSEAYNPAHAESTTDSIDVEPHDLADLVISLVKKIGLSDNPLVEGAVERIRVPGKNL